jgi:hypothetical protein
LSAPAARMLATNAFAIPSSGSAAIRSRSEVARGDNQR